MTQLMAFVSSLGNYAFVWMIVAIVMLFFAERRHVGISIIGAVIICGIIVGFVIQPLVGRVRPCDAGIGVTAVIGVSRTGLSFPSFHAATSFAAAMVLAMTVGKRAGIPAFACAALIAFSRIYLGVEYPTDILGGAVIGALIGLAAVWLYNQFLHDVVLERLGSSNRTSGRKSINERTAQRTRNNKSRTRRKAARRPSVRR